LLAGGLDDPEERRPLHLESVPLRPVGMTQTQIPTPEPLAYSITSACLALGLPRTTIFKLIDSKALPSFKEGRRRLIPVEGLRAYVESKLREG